MDEITGGCFGCLIAIALLVLLLVLAIKILASIGILILYLLVLIIQIFLSALLIAVTALVLVGIPALFIWIIVNLFREFDRRNLPIIASLVILSLTTISGLSLGFWLKNPMIQASDAWFKQSSQSITMQSSQSITMQPSQSITMQPSQSITTQPSQSETTQNASRWNFPLSECGDKKTPGLQQFYPVFVNKTNQKNLDYIQQSYCKDAFITTRKLTKKQAIQVASFRTKETAIDFARIMIKDPKINSGEVAEPTLN